MQVIFSAVPPRQTMLALCGYRDRACHRSFSTAFDIVTISLFAMAVRVVFWPLGQVRRGHAFHHRRVA